MTTTNVPLSAFDMWAGGKAAYEQFYAAMGQTPSIPWQELTAIRQKLWVDIAKAAIRAAKETKSRKVRRRLLRPKAERRIAQAGRLN